MLKRYLLVVISDADVVLVGWTADGGFKHLGVVHLTSRAHSLEDIRCFAYTHKFSSDTHLAFLSFPLENLLNPAFKIIKSHRGHVYDHCSLYLSLIGAV